MNHIHHEPRASMLSELLLYQSVLGKGFLSPFPVTRGMVFSAATPLDALDALRGDSMKNTIMALKDGFPAEADLLAEVAGSRVMWETQYNRPLFEALAAVCPPGKLRYLVYPAADDRDYWLGNRDRGAVVLGDEKFEEDEP